MSVFVKMFTNAHSVAPKYAEMQLTPGTKVAPTRSLHAAKFSGGLLFSGRDGAVDSLSTNQVGWIEFGTIKAGNFRCLLELNTEFGKNCRHTSLPMIIEPGDSLKLDLHFTSRTEIKVQDYDWLVKLYMLD